MSSFTVNEVHMISNKIAFQYDPYRPLVDCVSQHSLLRGVPGLGVALSGGCLVPSGAWSHQVPGPGGACSRRGRGIPACTEADPLWTEFLTHASENITLPQTSFASGNKIKQK